LDQFYNYGAGSVFEVAAPINGVTYCPTSAVPPLRDSPSTNPTNSSDNGVITRPLSGAPASLTGMNFLLSGVVEFGAYILA